MTDTRSWLILALITATGFLFYLLAPVLTPFLLAALLAYVGDPLVDRLEARKLSRTLAVTLVFTSMTLFAMVMLIILVPLVEKQLSAFFGSLPGYIDWLQNTAMPWLQQRLNLAETPDVGDLKQAVQENWQRAGGIAVKLISSITQSGNTLLQVLANLVLVPVLTFYLLRDWDVLVARVRELLPRHIEPLISQLSRDADEVLGAFMRGQLLVMLGLGLIYSVGLWITGLNYALLIGMIAGLLSFVPYLGVIIGLVLAGIAGLFQFDSVTDLWPVAVVFGIGQLVESFLLTPYLVGDRIGLHPVAVIFAIAAFGQLFGFFGILLALPAAAVVMVVLRYAHAQYRNSELYGATEPANGECGDGC